MLALAFYLGVKATNEESWPGWTIFAAQTMLSSEHWARDGFVANKFLFIPIGYSKIVRYLDEPEMRHHTRGTVTGGLIGKRLYYTHYPSGYLVPYALLMKAGFKDRHWFRFLSLTFSLGALVLLYAFMNRIAGPAVALFVALYYGMSTMFLDYADSLANQPLDDLLRFTILLASVLALRKTVRSGNCPGWAGGTPVKYVLFIWAVYFLLGISSYDSFFFVFTWLVGLDLVAGEVKGEDGKLRLPWKKWLVYGSAPLAAFSIQILQNTWYLGFEDMLLDLKGTFLDRSKPRWETTGPVSSRIYAGLLPLVNMTGLKLLISIPAVSAVAFAVMRLKTVADEDRLAVRAIPVLLMGGLAYTFLLSFTGSFIYQGRQLAPAISLIVGSATVLVWRHLTKAAKPGEAGPGRGGFPGTVMALFLVPVLALLWGAQIHRTSEYVAAWPNHVMKKETIDYLKTLGSLTENDAVIFNYVEGYQGNRDSAYPQPDPVEEYYTGRTVLSFTNLEDLKRDLKWLRDRAEEPFDSIIVSKDKESLRDISRSLELPGDVYIVAGRRYAFLVRGEPKKQVSNNSKFR